MNDFVLRPLTIAHVVLSLDVGGLERMVVDLVQEGARLGHQAAVVCLVRRGELAAQVEALGARVLCCDKQPGIRPGVVKQLVRLFREIQPDVVHTHQIGALFYAGPAARRTGAPAVVHTEHGKHYSQRLRTRWLGRLAGRYAGRLCCVSRDVAAEVRRVRIVREEKITVVANGIDAARFARETNTAALRRELGIPADAPVVGTIGRLHEIKRQDRLVRAFASLAQSRPDAHLVIVGDGPLRGELQRLATSLAPIGHVHFAGYQAEPERYLQLMDVFALTSRSEGMPLAVLESWAAGVPVAASRVGGLPELVENGVTGMLFEPHDEAGLVNALEHILADAGLARRLSHAGRDRVEREFNLGRMAGAYQRLYCELFERRAARDE